MSDLTLQEFRPLPPEKELGEVLREEARKILGEKDPIGPPVQPSSFAWFLRCLKALTSPSQAH